MLYFLLFLIWVFAAVVTVKLDAAVSMRPSDYKHHLLLSLVGWPVTAGLLLFTRHEVSPERTTDY